MKKSFRAVVLAAAVAAVFASDPARSEPRGGDSRPHVILLSIDGLRPDFYLSPDFETLNLRALAARGASARAVEPAFPSCTYPGHASIVTGVRPARHRIVANTRWGERGSRPEWMWEARELGAKPLWKAAHEQGLTVAITQWPTTVGADVDWLVPERWSVRRGESTRDLLLASSTPGLLIELGLALGVPDLEAGSLADRSKIDEFVAGAAAHMLVSRRPALVLAHLIQVDEVEHGQGRDGPEVRAAVKRVDACVGQVVTAARDAGMLEQTVVVVVGDHGFTDATTTAAPNVLLARAGLVDVERGAVSGWRALGQAFGGSMAIHAKDDASAAKAREILERGAVQGDRRLWRVVPPEEARALGADPDAAFYLDAGENVDLGEAASGELATDHGRTGTHGGIPTRPQLATGFVAAGPGIRHTELERMRLVDVAPTLARVLRVELPDTDGGVVRILEEDPD